MKKPGQFTLREIVCFQQMFTVYESTCERFDIQFKLIKITKIKWFFLRWPGQAAGFVHLLVTFTASVLLERNTKHIKYSRFISNIINYIESAWKSKHDANIVETRNKIYINKSGNKSQLLHLLRLLVGSVSVSVDNSELLLSFYLHAFHLMESKPNQRHLTVCIVLLLLLPQSFAWESDTYSSELKTLVSVSLTHIWGKEERLGKGACCLWPHAWPIKCMNAFNYYLNLYIQSFHDKLDRFECGTTNNLVEQGISSGIKWRRRRASECGKHFDWSDGLRIEV